MTKRLDGWYWVKWIDRRDSDWQVAEYGEGHWYHWKYSELPNEPFEVGPRIIAPSENSTSCSVCGGNGMICWKCN